MVGECLRDGHTANRHCSVGLRPPEGEHVAIVVVNIVVTVTLVYVTYFCFEGC